MGWTEGGRGGTWRGQERKFPWADSQCGLPSGRALLTVDSDPALNMWKGLSGAGPGRQRVELSGILKIRPLHPQTDTHRHMLSHTLSHTRYSIICTDTRSRPTVPLEARVASLSESTPSSTRDTRATWLETPASGNVLETIRPTPSPRPDCPGMVRFHPLSEPSRVNFHSQGRKGERERRSSLPCAGDQKQRPVMKRHGLRWPCHADCLEVPRLPQEL